jgi:lathosterol oxidase
MCVKIPRPLFEKAVKYFFAIYFSCTCVHISSPSVTMAGQRRGTGAVVAEAALQVAAGLLLCASRSAAAVAMGKDIAVTLLEMDEPSDVAVASVLIFAGYTLQYLAAAGLFEATHPFGIFSTALTPHQLSKRRAQARARLVVTGGKEGGGGCNPAIQPPTGGVQVWRELGLGVGALISVVVVTVMWMAYVEPHLWTYGFFTRHEYTCVPLPPLPPP